MMFSSLTKIVLIVSVACMATATPVSVETWSGLVTINNPVIVPIETCVGTDGTYSLLHVTGTGPMVATDPRLSGNFVADALILDSPASGFGVSVDNWVINDPVTGAQKASGKAIATDQGPNPKAISYGFLADGELLVANTLVTLPAPGSGAPLTIAYGGGATTVPDRGVVLGGFDKCTRKILKAIFSH